MYAIHSRNVEAALVQGLATLKSYGVKTVRRGMEVIEMPMPVATRYQLPRERVLFNPVRDANPFFHFFESLWVLAGRNDVAFLEYMLPRMAQYSDNGKTFHGAYGHRLRNAATSYQDAYDRPLVYDQITDAIQLLQESPDTRQCVLSIWDPYLDLRTATKDMPCNDMVMLSRGGVEFSELNMTVCNRSNDAIWGAYGANAVQFSMLQEYIAASVGCSVGSYTQVSNNYHVYTDNPFWQEYERTTRYDELLGHTKYYAMGIVKPYDMFKQRYLFDRDLQAFFRSFDENMSQPEYESEAFNDVVSPMWACFNLYKNNLLKDAWAETSNIAATDWQSACAEWLARRIEKRGM